MTRTPRVPSSTSEAQRALGPHTDFITCPPSTKSVVNSRNLGEGAYRGISAEPLGEASAGCLPLQASPGADGTRLHRQAEVRGSGKEQLQLLLGSRQDGTDGMYVGRALDKKAERWKVKALQILGKISQSWRHLIYLILQIWIRKFSHNYLKIKAWILEEILKAIFWKIFFLNQYANIVFLQAEF